MRALWLCANNGASIWLSLCYCFGDCQVCGGGITDSGVEHIARIPELKTLSLAQNPRVTDASLPFLMQLRGLQTLNLSQSSVTGKALQQHLTALSKLETLALYGTSRVKASTVLCIQKRLPNLHVVGVAM
mmetsp:Transcript_15050/g.38705  ORF Transcript_15050/g.38705 Transcript_15050/m.38705 type:complete len:130 (+) Transcript_15050:2117-2506(+)